MKGITLYLGMLNICSPLPSFCQSLGLSKSRKYFSNTTYHILSHFFDNPPSKFSFKSKMKSAVMDYWEQHLQAQADLLPSLKYFSPQFMSLSTTHPMFVTCTSSPYEVYRHVSCLAEHGSRPQLGTGIGIIRKACAFFVKMFSQHLELY